MRNARASAWTVAVIVFLGVTSADGARADTPPRPSEVVIATGVVGGLYHPVGGALCALLNEGRKAHGISCTVEITDGSIDNINRLRTGGVEFAIVQSDVHHAAFNGAGSFQNDGAFADLRSVAALFMETLTIVVQDRTDIDGFEALKGRRVYMGPAGSSMHESSVGSSTHHTMTAVMKAHGWPIDAVIDTPSLEGADPPWALCRNAVDALVLTIGHPNPVVKEAALTCDGRLVPIDDAVIDTLVAQHPFYVPTMVPGGLYPLQRLPLRSLGLVAALVTSAATDPDVVYHLTRAILVNLERMQAASPLFLGIAREDRAWLALTAPVHAGAARAFGEAGITLTPPRP